MSAHVAAILSGPMTVAVAFEPFASLDSRAARSARNNENVVNSDRKIDRKTVGQLRERTLEPFEAPLIELVDDADDELRIVLTMERCRAEHRAERRDEEHEVRHGLSRVSGSVSATVADHGQLTRTMGTRETRRKFGSSWKASMPGHGHLP